MSEPEVPKIDVPPNAPLVFAENIGCPFIFFDGVSCNGSMHGVVEIELAARILSPAQDGSVAVKYTPTVRLRCSPTAAKALSQAIDVVLKMT